MLTHKPYITPNKDNYKYVHVSTEPVTHSSQAVNYGKPILLDYYIARCLKCSQECTTANVIDGEEKNGTILEPVIYLLSARCTKCSEEWFF